MIKKKTELVYIKGGNEISIEKDTDKVYLTFIRETLGKKMNKEGCYTRISNAGKDNYKRRIIKLYFNNDWVYEFHFNMEGYDV